MKIMYVITKSEIGGAQVHLRDLMKSMILDGHQVALMSYPGGWLVDEANRMGVVFYPNINFSNSYNILSTLRASFAITKSVRDFKPDVVHCHSSMAGFLGRMTIKNKIPTVFTAHSWAFTDGAPLFRKKIALVAERFVAKYTSKIICVSDYDRSLAVKHNIAPVEKFITIHNGVHVDEGPKINTNNFPLKIISIGRLAYPKRPDILIEAIKDLPDQILGKIELHIIGDGPMKSSLSKKIIKYGLEKTIRLSGSAIYENIHGLLKGSDIFVLISKHEGLPMTILEAMNVGLPVIASQVGGIPEEIDEKSGLLLGSNSPKEIRDKLVLLIEDSKMREIIGATARERMSKFFSLEKFLAETKKVYEEVVR